jgi:hypothetical protein
MPQPKTSRVLYIIIAVALAGLTQAACEIRTQPRYAQAPPPAGQVAVAQAAEPDGEADEDAAEQPPVEQVEAPPPPASAAHVWVRGRWTWRGRWQWTPGRWLAPRHGRTWMHGHWERRGARHVWIGGRWN